MNALRVCAKIFGPNGRAADCADQSLVSDLRLRIHLGLEVRNIAPIQLALFP